jgi:FdhD protein
MHVVCEDVGRQNAVDKIIGLSYEELDIPKSLLLLSGRLTLEVVTKAVNSGYPVLASFAVATAQGIELAKEHGLTLVGGLKENRFWLYNEGRVKISTESDSI